MVQIKRESQHLYCTLSFSLKILKICLQLSDNELFVNSESLNLRITGYKDLLSSIESLIWGLEKNRSWPINAEI